jgi:uncharacterized membrane protein YvbJ
MPFCGECGARHEAGARFCEGCGSRLEERQIASGWSYSRERRLPWQATGIGAVALFAILIVVLVVSRLGPSPLRQNASISLEIQLDEYKKKGSSTRSHVRKS